MHSHVGTLIVELQAIFYSLLATQTPAIGFDKYGIWSPLCSRAGIGSFGCHRRYRFSEASLSLFLLQVCLFVP